MPKRYDSSCDFVMTKGARKGQPCGVGCRSSEGGRCAKHRPSAGTVVETCSICLDDVTFPSLRATRTVCGHAFHKTCLAKVVQPQCPMCRAAIDPGLVRPQLRVATPRREPMVFRPPVDGSVQRPIDLTGEGSVALVEQATLVNGVLDQLVRWRTELEGTNPSEEELQAHRANEIAILRAVLQEADTPVRELPLGVELIG